MSRTKSGGRKAGTPNKISATVKDNVLAVFNRLEGTAGMAEWAKANRTEFYKIYARLIPAEMKSEIEHTGAVVLEHAERPKLTKQEWLELHGLGTATRPTK